MQPEEIKKMIEMGIPDSQVTVTGDGHHFEAIVISTFFENMSLINRQRSVHKTLGDNILNGNIHALSIKAKTQKENNEGHG